MIHKVFKAFAVRKSMKKIAIVKRKVDSVEMMISASISSKASIPMSESVESP